MTHKGTVTLKAGRLILRRFTMDDADAMFRNWASDPEVTKYLTWQPHTSTDVTLQHIDSMISNYAEPHFYQWAIVPKDLDETVGGINIVCLNMDTGGPLWKKQLSMV